MRIEKYIPAEIFRPYIKCFLIIETAENIVNKVMPDTSVVAIFKIGGQISIGSGDLRTDIHTGALSGIMHSSRLINYGQHSASLLVVFNPGGAAAFFNENIYDLAGKTLPLNSIISTNTLTEIEERLTEASSNTQRIVIIEQYLLTRLRYDRNDLLINRAVNKIFLTHGSLKIRDLLNDYPISRDPFEKRFRRITGTTPKKFSAIVRLRHIMDSHSANETILDTALSAGYYDQAHFIKDFKEFTSLTPGQFLQSGAYW